jgi:hypothetical protein
LKYASSMSLISLWLQVCRGTTIEPVSKSRNPDLCQSSDDSCLTANKGDSNHEGTKRGVSEADHGPPEPGLASRRNCLVRSPWTGPSEPGAAPGSAAFNNCSCRMESLWTVNLGAGLGTVSGAWAVAPRSPPAEPANPVHAPIILPRPTGPELSRKEGRPPLTIPRRAVPRGRLIPHFNPWAPRPLTSRRRDAKWSGSFSQQDCCSSSVPASS